MNYEKIKPGTKVQITATEEHLKDIGISKLKEGSLCIVTRYEGRYKYSGHNYIIDGGYIIPESYFKIIE